ncbi:glycine--tRNA ligase [Candidatus Woesearchaeota archaeon]|mgnify:CR=1 FL=1|nr:MAG: glycine--tRNA ligase [Candidatus Woesearchaeota archaeon]
MEKEALKELIAFMQSKGFIWGPSPEIYGGLAGFYTFAPLGKLLKNNVEEAIRKTFQKYEMYEVECPTVMPARVWEASGHLTGFTDPMIECEKCKSIFRVDTLIEEFLPEQTISGLKNKELLKIIKAHKIKCPTCSGKLREEIKQHSLMMRTTVGVDIEAYNRPETATTTYLPFTRYVDFFRDKLPFGIFQIGKAFRNEISPRQHVLRMREFTQAEAQLFIFEDQKNEFEPYNDVKDRELPIWSSSMQKEKKQPAFIKIEDAILKGWLTNRAFAWTLYIAYDLFLNIGIPKEKMRFRQHQDDEKAFYVEDAWDLEIQLNTFGWTECCGVHDRSNYDLKQHSKFSGKELVARDYKNNKQIPHILEIAFGTDRPTFALLDLFYEKRVKGEGKTMFKVPYKLAPIKVAVFPLVNKEKLPEIAQQIHRELLKDFTAVYDKSGAIGRRYLRNDEAGTPFCITVDFQTLEDKTVTIRNRDDEKQIRIKVEELKSILTKLFEGSKLSDFGKYIN